MAGLGRLLEELGRALVVARDAGLPFGENEAEPVIGFARSRIGGVLKRLHRLLGLAAIEQHHTQPGFGIGVARGVGPEGLFGGYEIAGPVGRNPLAHRRRIGALVRLRLHRCIREDERPRQRSPKRPPTRHDKRGARDHFVLKVKATASALAFSISSGFS